MYVRFQTASDPWLKRLAAIFFKRHVCSIPDFNFQNDIVAVNEVFKSLGQMVHDQEILVDSIEAHVESAASQVSEGAQQLRLASQHQVCTSL